jgi:hypothetical protein
VIRRRRGAETSQAFNRVKAGKTVHSKKRRMTVTTKADYTAEEWELLMRAPFMAGMAVVAASPSGPIGLIKEMFAVGRVLVEGSGEGESNELISALVSEVKAGHRPAAPTESLQSVEAAKALALNTCREVAALLARKAPAAEAEGFKRWLLTAAQRVAEASKEGGFLGIGGVRVSEAETAALAEVASALEVTA